MKKFFIFLFVLASVAGCTSVHEDVLGTGKTQLQMRNYQSRAFDTTDKEMVLRSVVSTMQDLGFIIERADHTLGTISGTSFTYGASKLTVSIRQIGKQIVVRANAQQGLSAIEEPQAYQNFFNALGQSLFLEAHEIQ